jgi:hypothetical protein
MGTAVIPEPIAQLQRQLDQIRSTQRRGRSIRIRRGKPQSNWPGNMVCILSRILCGWTIWG